MSKNTLQPQNPLILRFLRLMDAFAKSDDERDFYLSKEEGYLVYVDLDKSEEDLLELQKELSVKKGQYCLVPKMTFYEVKKFMEGFINEKVYDIDTKEKLLDIISSRGARENFLEFIYDHLTELEKWQQYYQERSRIRIIEWLRSQDVVFVFEEDLDLNRTLMEKIKRQQFESKVPKDVAGARQMLFSKAKTYYSNEALNPRPKRGRPPKQQAKVEVEPQFTVDIYTTVPKSVKRFLYIPDITSASFVTFSAGFKAEQQLIAALRGSSRLKVDEKLEALSQRLESLRQLSSTLSGNNKKFGLESTKSFFQPFSQPKFKEGKAIDISHEDEEKVGGVVEEVFPQQKGTPPKDGEDLDQARRFSIKKVAQIKQPKKKK